MALTIPDCVVCKKTIFPAGSMRSGGWVCDVCEPREPEISLHWSPDPGYYPDGKYVLQGNTRAMKPCETCGNLWGSKGAVGISYKDLEEHGMKGHYLSEIEHSTREFIEGKRAAVRNIILAHWKKPIPTCSKCPKARDG